MRTESPSRTYEAVPISGTGDPRTAPTTALVLALFTLGIHADDDCPFMETLDTGCEPPAQTHVWLLKPKSADRKHNTAKLVEAWNDPAREWFKRNPEHPFSYLNGYYRQQTHVFAELGKSVPLGIVRKGDRCVLIPLDATDDEESVLLAKLEA